MNSLFSSRKLIAFTKTKFKFDQFFLRLFYRETYAFDTQTVDLSKIPGEVDMALYVSPVISGEVLRTRGGEVRQFKPGYVKPKHEVSAEMLTRILPDEDPDAPSDPAARRIHLIAQNLQDEELAIQQVEEQQAVDAVLYGKYTMASDKFEAVEVDMGRNAANNITQTPLIGWSTQNKDTFDPTDDLETYADFASGLINIAVMDQKAWALFRSFKIVREKLDTRRGSTAELETALKDLGKAASYKGYFGDVAIVVYHGQKIVDGKKTRYMPDNTIVLGNTQARGIRTYGMTADVEIIKAGITRGTRFPKNWIQPGDPAREFTMTQSAPLMVLADPDEFVVITLA
ncbi:major capsid protein E [Klebsiella pneumoniae]|uniref:major capsid protein n=1 Tax=Klebsiella pneumoniae TaxID=573 RepID=UPI000847E608|nr:major capsid protein [Klebsiella pneumoniae]MCS6630589.1 major capsid protein [Klebsiella pneumoniae subsp. pneumoniae]ODP88744.1 major capsid protein E [Klebsiella pneumoniae]